MSPGSNSALWPFGLSLALATTISAATNIIGSGETINDTLGAGETNAYSFTAIADEVVTIQLTGGGPLFSFPFFELHGPGGMPVITVSSGGLGGGGIWAYLSAQRLTNTGTYHILVRDDQGQQSYPYGLTLIKNPGPNPADDGGTIDPGQTVTNSLSGLGDIDVYSFTAVANDIVTIQLTGGGANFSYPYFELHGPGGKPAIAVSSMILGGNGFWAYRSALPLTNAGTYQILVRDDEGRQSYPYGLTLIKNPGPNPADDGGTIDPGQTVTNSLSGLGDIDVYSFTAVANDVVTIQLTGGGANFSYPYFELHGPGGKPAIAVTSMILGGNGFWAYRSALPLTNAGTYQILVRDDEGKQSYPYGLTLIKSPGPNLADDGGTIDPGQTVTNSLNYLADIDVFSFTAVANDVVTIQLTGGGPNFSYPYFELHGPGGKPAIAVTSMILGGNGFWAYLAAQRLTNAGTYQILVRDDEGRQSYPYGLTLIKSPGPNAVDQGEADTDLNPYVSRAGTISFADIDLIPFTAIAGDSIEVLVEWMAGGGNSLVVELQAPDGSILAVQAGSLPARLTTPCAPRTGRYFIRIRDDDGRNTFGYTVWLSQTPIVPPSSGNLQYLAVLACSNHVILRWETNSVGFALESSPSLTAPSWMPVDLPRQVVDYHYYVDQGVVTNGYSFYRLRCSDCP